MQHKNCPFCDSSELDEDTIYGAMENMLTCVHVICKDCGASAPEPVWNDRYGVEDECQE